MRIERADPTISVGYANKGMDDPNVHLGTTEAYLAARGTSEIRVEQEGVCLRAGDIIVIEPGEAHTP